LNSSRIRKATEELILAIEGEIRPQLRETPQRVQRMWEEILNGYEVEIPSLFKAFDGEGKDQLVVVRNIHTYSICCHHLIPFEIVASVAYLPKDKVLGVSKLARLVSAYAHRLQLQERITEQVANTIMEYLEPHGVGVIIKGAHLCMRMRGAKSEQSEVITSVMLGAFRDDYPLRNEVLNLLQGEKL